MNEKFYNLTNDIIFIYVFGSERNKKLLLSLLNSIMESAGNELLESVELVNTITQTEYPDDKISIMDIKGVDSKGKRYNIEMQVNKQVDYIQRIIFYNDKMYCEQIGKGESFNNLNKSITVSLLSFNLLENEKNIHNVYRYTNVKSFNQLTDIKELHFIELNKFDSSKPRAIMSKFEKWLSLIINRELDMQNLPYNIKEEPEIYQAFLEMQKANSDPKIRELIEIREKAEHDEASRLLTAEIQGYTKGEKSGIKKGEKIGFEKGALATKSIIVEGLYKSGMELSMIAEVAQLSIEDVNNILGLD